MKKLFNFVLFMFLFVACSTYKMTINPETIVLATYQELYDSILVKKIALDIPRDSFDRWEWNALLMPDGSIVRQYWLHYPYNKKEDILLYVNIYNSDSLEYHERRVERIENK